MSAAALRKFPKRGDALLVAPHGSMRDEVRHAFAPVPLELHVASDVRRVVDLLKHQPCQLLLVEPSCLGPAPLEVLAEIKALPDPPFVLAIVERFSAKGLIAMLQGGVDDFLRLPLSLDELMVRMHRVRAPHPVREGSGLRRIAPRLAAWPSLETYPAALAKDLGGFAGVDLSVGAAGPPLIDVVGATIVLTQHDGQSELTVRIEMARATANPIIEGVLGMPPDEELLGDMVREIANLAGGALKRCILADGVSFTMGIPNYFVGAPEQEQTKPDLSFDLGSKEGPVRCVLSSRRTVVMALPLHALREGLVLARDVRGANGMLLLTGGLRLTATTIEGLQKSLERTTQVEIVHVS